MFELVLVWDKLLLTGTIQNVYNVIWFCVLIARYEVRFDDNSSSVYGCVPDAAGFALRCPFIFYSYTSGGGGNFQQTHGDKQSVLPGLPRPVDRSRPLHHDVHAFT